MAKGGTEQQRGRWAPGILAHTRGPPVASNQHLTAMHVGPEVAAPLGTAGPLPFEDGFRVKEEGTAGELPACPPRVA